jgi:SAM-dependent methyltransferase
MLNKINDYYSNAIKIYGATPKGVDWNDEIGQELRFSKLMAVAEDNNSFTVNDFGCGYGALLDYLSVNFTKFNYIGFDISETMIEFAKLKYSRFKNAKFTISPNDLTRSDFTVASGVFNVKLDCDTEDWRRYILENLERFNNLSNKGFAFNALTSYSDPDKRSPNLYYADPLEIFDFCKRNFSRNVSLSHDYNLYEFTIIVKK